MQQSDFLLFLFLCYQFPDETFQELPTFSTAGGAVGDGLDFCEGGGASVYSIHDFTVGYVVAVTGFFISIHFFTSFVDFLVNL